jgi:hypothetical protein
MFSTKKYVDDLLTGLLSDWVDSYDETSVNVGLWNGGDVRLSNLALKKRTFDINTGISATSHVSLELGSVGNVQLQIPWTQLARGGFQVSADDISLVFRFHQLSDERNDADSSFESKMKSISREELKLLGGVAADGTSNYWSKFVKSCASSIFSRIASGFHLKLTNINISVFMQLDSGCVESEFAVIRLSIPAIDIRPQSPSEIKHGTATDSISNLLSKDINVRGLTICISKESTSLNISSSFNDNDSSSSFNDNDSSKRLKSSSISTLATKFAYSVESPLTGILLNAVNMEISAVVSLITRDSQSSSSSDGVIDSTIDKTTQHQLTLRTELSNVEFSPTLQQLYLISGVLSSIQSQQIQSKIQALRPTNKTPVRGNARQWWKYAFCAVRELINEKQSTSGDGYSGRMRFRSRLGSLVSIMVLRRQYISRYRQALHLELDIINGSDSNRSKIKSKAELGIVSCYQDLRTLHESLGEAEVLLFRSFVLTLLQREGRTLVALRLAVKACSLKFVPLNFPPPSIGAAGVLSSTDGSLLNQDTGTNSNNDSDSDELVTNEVEKAAAINDDDFISVHQYLNKKNTPANKVTTLSVSVSLSISRLAVTVLEEALSSTPSSLTVPLGVNIYTESSSLDGTRGNVGANGEGVRSVFSLLMYGIQVKVLSAEYEEDKPGQSFDLKIGALRAFGLKGKEILTCGGDPNEWMDAKEGKDHEPLGIYIYIYVYMYIHE